MRFGQILTALVLLTHLPSEACTEIKLVTKDGSIVHGRTAEFGVKLDLSVVIIPRNYSFTGTTPLGNGLTYKSKYAAVGMIAYDNPAVLDGLNEQGLSVGAFYFPNYAQYANITSANQTRALSPVEFSNWVLTQFATVDEVKDGIVRSNIAIAPTVLNRWGSNPPPFHYIVLDKNGKCIVIEPREGRLMIHDNPLGIITNSPTFDWHMTNLNNFVNLTPFNVPPKIIQGVKFVPFGQGSGLVGLPGDFSPPSRFVRSAIFSNAAIPAENASDAVFQAFHILNQFDIPVGVVRSLENNVVFTDETIATAVRDPQALHFYYRTYDDQTIKRIDLKKFDYNAKELKTMPTAGKQSFVDVSSDLK